MVPYERRVLHPKDEVYCDHDVSVRMPRCDDRAGVGDREPTITPPPKERAQGFTAKATHDAGGAVRL